MKSSLKKLKFASEKLEIRTGKPQINNDGQQQLETRELAFEQLKFFFRILNFP